MTRHKHAHTGLVTPSPLDRWIDATLRLFAMLVHNVASTLQMICRHAAVIGTQAMPSDLPKAKTDTQQQESKTAAQHSSPTNSAHGEQRIEDARPSNHERDITGCHPGNAQRYPGPTDPVGQTAQWFPALRYAPAGMTIEAAQPARSLNSASPHLRSSRRKSGSKAPRVMLATGLHMQPWIPAFAGMSGELITAKDAPLN